MAAETQLTRRRAITIAILCLACGVGPVLGAIGVGPFHLSPGVPPWMGAAAGGTNADGSLPPNTPSPIRFIQTASGLGIVVVMGAMATWIAFGRGERHFSQTVVLPFTAYHAGSGELSGRIAFGIAALLIWAIVVTGTVAALKKHLARLRST